ncbi:c-type cytochrome [Pseudochelatococcus contaminans]|uniref:Cytochrome c n=1 Tax=Pseudochelatococcus contaminans TaxID=1538103 RepID=A0A7W5Z1D3_9HYPH|nr:cytochrome c family protein [Pseudochelatococcus contaminans]MBB3808285.1 cytochrome c [Pseudochelatococcus contaminans]
MNRFDLNRIAAVVLSTLLVVTGAGIISNAVLDGPSSGDDDSTLSNTVAAPVAPAAPATTVAQPAVNAPPAPLQDEELTLATLLARADPARGARAAIKCRACHNFVPGGSSRAGPGLYDIIDRPVGASEKFGYSTAMRAHAGTGATWTYEELDRFITNPKKYIPGTTMSFAGLAKPTERADIIAYLRTLSPSPVPLPASDDTPAP